MKNEEKDLGPRTKMFARRIIRLYCALPKSDTVAQVLGRQALRAGTSVGANYREANRARSKAEFIAKMGDCLKEADEALYWLELLIEERIVPRQAATTACQRSQRACGNHPHHHQALTRTRMMRFFILHFPFFIF